MSAQHSLASVRDMKNRSVRYAWEIDLEQVCERVFDNNFVWLFFSIVFLSLSVRYTWEIDLAQSCM